MVTLKSKVFIAAIFIYLVSGTVLAEDEKVDIEAVNTLYPTKDIISSGQPTENDFAKLKKAGVTTVINLRTKGEHKDFDEKSLVESLGMNYIHIPVAGMEGMNKKNTRKLDKALAKSKGRVLVHCASGNRVGGLFALRAFYLQGKTAEEAMAFGKDSGLTRLAPTIESKLTTESKTKAKKE